MPFGMQVRTPWPSVTRTLAERAWRLGVVTDLAELPLGGVCLELMTAALGSETYSDAVLGLPRVSVRGEGVVALTAVSTTWVVAPDACDASPVPDIDDRWPRVRVLNELARVRQPDPVAVVAPLLFLNVASIALRQGHLNLGESARRWLG